MRYAQLLQAVEFFQPTAILEVGTWNGHRAREMLEIVPKAKYYGYDLFEDATAETDAAELNVKPHNRLDDVAKLLAKYDVTLIKGNTRDTLPKHRGLVDFVWLDGGHSVETIASDWHWVQKCLAGDAAVFFDDYYSGPIDTTKFGCNEIVKDLRHRVLPKVDPVSGGGWVQMVQVFP